jgi:hypothetical protein
MHQSLPLVIVEEEGEGLEEDESGVEEDGSAVVGGKLFESAESRVGF